MRNNKLKIKYVLKARFVIVLTIGLGFGFVAVPASAQDIQPVYRYTKTPTVGSSSSSLAYGVATDSSGATYTTGEFNDTIDFAGTDGNDSITTVNGTAYVSKHNHDGSYAWTRSLDTSNNGYAQATGAATDANNNVYVVGSFSGGATFDGPGGNNSQSINGSGTFINKYSSNGTYIWTKTIIPPANGQAAANTIGIDAAGNLYVGGSFSGTVNFAATNGGTDNQTDAGGNGDSFVTRFNSDGSYGWTRSFDTTTGYTGAAQVKSIAVDPAGSIYLTGYYSGAINFAAGTGNNDTQTDTGGNGSVYVTKFATNGNYGWTRSFENSNSYYVNANSLAADPSGNVYITGSFSGTPNFAGSLGTDNQTDAGGSGDAYLTKLTPTGNYGWTKTFDTSPGGYAAGDTVTTDVNGDIYVLSGFGNTVNFAGTSGSDSQTQTSSGAITMYAPDGTYRWTRAFDTTNGTAVVTQGIYTGLATDTTGNLYAASVYTGTVGFDGSGGSDAQTAGGYGSTFLTSYKTFVPGSTTAVAGQPNATTAVTAATANAATPIRAQITSVKAPNTGYGSSVQNNTVAVLALIGVALGLATIAIKLRSHQPMVVPVKNE